ncbi:MAG: hypothetical protein ACYC1D_05115 [Acidimicrobiales bacterium]
MAITNRTEQRRPGRPIGAPKRAGSAYQANREALEPLLRLLLDAAALATLLYRRSAPKPDEREARAAS